MKLFSSIHNPKSKRYAIYYSIVLVGVSATILVTTLQYIHQGPLQNIMTFFEGFFSLFMLSRNEQVGKAFLSHLSSIKGIIKPQ